MKTGPKIKLRKGQRFGKLKVLGDSNYRSTPYGYEWLCKCDCGVLTWQIVTKLKNGGSKSCGCGWKDVRRRPIKGAKYGMLTVTGKYQRSSESGKSTQWECKCDCGSKTWVGLYKLTSGHTKSCGCLKVISRKNKKHDLSGMAFGKLTVQKQDTSVLKGVHWVCKCECGNIKTVPSSYLLTGGTRSCGCLKYTLTATEREMRLKSRKSAHPEWAIVRSKCFERDNYACEVCGTSGVSLNAHHLNNWKDHPKKRYCLNNLVTLCVSCHKEFHRIYGRRNNTIEQINVFKKQR